MEEGNKRRSKDWLLLFSVLVSGVLIAGSLIYSSGLKYWDKGETDQDRRKVEIGDGNSKSNFEEEFIPEGGVVLPVKWENLGSELVRAGVINLQKFETVYKQRGGLKEKEKQFIYDSDNGNIVVDRETAPFSLNIFWALGLGNKNSVLEQGPMVDTRYGGVQNFASTAGWTLASGNMMEHFSKHPLVSLTAEQEGLVREMAKNIYRPCCDNSAYFPDCNHGMAMLGFLELAASQGVNKQEMYKAALLLNSYWFPENYFIIGKYLEKKGISWDKINAQEILGKNFSSASGYSQIVAQMTPIDKSGGSECGV